MHALADVSPRVLDGGVSVDVGQLAEAEAVVVVNGRVPPKPQNPFQRFSQVSWLTVLGDGNDNLRMFFVALLAPLKDLLEGLSLAVEVLETLLLGFV